MHSLLHHNTFGIDAWCREFIEYNNLEELKEVLPRLTSERWLHIGSGSNLLFVKDYNGIILHSGIQGCLETKRDNEHVWLKVGSGYDWDEFVGFCVMNHFYGLENLSYIPGEVGASAVQNIGAYGVEVGQFIDTVEAIDVQTGTIRNFKNEECEYRYRDSIFKNSLKGKYIIVSVTYKLNLNFNPDLEYGAIKQAIDKSHISKDMITALALRNLIIDIRSSKLPNPDDTGSAGSFFVNPIISEDDFNKLLNKYPNIPHYQVENGIKVPAGWMIEKCGWKGRSLGPAGVYSKQALVLVNLGGATGEDIVHLSDTIRKDVFEEFGIDLHPEVNFIE